MSQTCTMEAQMGQNIECKLGNNPDDAEPFETLTQITPHGTFRKFEIDGVFFYQIYDGVFNDWTTLPKSQLPGYILPDARKALIYADAVRDQSFIDWEDISNVHPIPHILLPYEKEENLLKIDTTPDSRDSIHLYIHSHGSDLGSIPFDERVRMFFQASNSTYSYVFQEDILELKKMYQTNIPTSDIISIWKSSCIKNVKSLGHSFLMKDARKINPYNKRILNAVDTVGHKICYESGIQNNREYSFTKGIDKALSLIPTNLYGLYSGSIGILKCTIDGIPQEQGDLLSDLPFENNLLDWIRKSVRILVLRHQSYSQNGKKQIAQVNLQLSELLLLLSHFSRIYIYDFGCRINSSDIDIEPYFEFSKRKSIHPLFVHQKEISKLSLLRTPSFERNSDEQKEGKKKSTRKLKRKLKRKSNRKQNTKK